MWMRIKRYWLPVTLGLLGLLLLLRVFFSAAFILVPEEVDVVVLVVLLSVTMVAAIHTIVSISMNHLRLRSVQGVRQETLAEHRRFLSRLDHELKNPLTALRAGLRTLVLTPLDEQQRQIVETMETETLRLSRLVTDLRKLAELETQPLNLQPVHMPTFIMNVVQMEHERFEASQRKLTSNITPAQVGQMAQETWVVDEDLLALAVHNLLDNAFKYSLPGDGVKVEVAIQQELIIRVVDSGIGIPQDALPHIWEELYRAQQMASIPGSGTGLALVKAIVERHEGTVNIESKVEQGTAVTLRLPRLPHLS